MRALAGGRVGWHIAWWGRSRWSRIDAASQTDVACQRDLAAVVAVVVSMITVVDAADREGIVGVESRARLGPSTATGRAASRGQHWRCERS